MRMLFLIAGLAYGVYLFTGGSLGTDSIFGPPETLPLSRYDDIDVSVYFYYPDETERYLGDVRASRRVGWTLNKSFNVEPKVPAHRVVNSLGMLSGALHFSTDTPG